MIQFNLLFLNMCFYLVGVHFLDFLRQEGQSIIDRNLLIKGKTWNGKRRGKIKDYLKKLIKNFCVSSWQCLFFKIYLKFSFFFYSYLILYPSFSSFALSCTFSRVARVSLNVFSNMFHFEKKKNKHFIIIKDEYFLKFFSNFLILLFIFH